MLPPVASRFVAGETAAAALDHARRMNDEGVGVLLNHLGEHYDRRAPADADAAEYVRLVDDVAPTPLDVCLSVKPSQLGLDVSESVFRENLTRVVDHAAANDVFVWLDMEDHTTTDATLDAFAAHATGGARVGVCVQANLRRTGDDLRRLADLPGKVRLVKGAYSPPPDVAYQTAERVNRAYRDHLRFMFEAFDDGIAVGSHDPAMIDLAADLHTTHATPYEVQMLMGVRTDAQVRLAADRPVYQYAPYGSRWLSYFSRRLRERKANVLFALRALLRG
jgi:proline dehydrogenase